MKRRDLLKAILSLVAAHSLGVPAFAQAPTGKKMPVLFIGHGSPMNVLRDNAFTQHLNILGETLPAPRAIVVISAHWIAKQPTLSTASNPETIYDFGGFPDELYKIRYPCVGKPELANRLVGDLNRYDSRQDAERGLDHGAWTVLHHLYPKANIPVIQLSS